MLTLDQARTTLSARDWAMLTQDLDAQVALGATNAWAKGCADRCGDVLDWDDVVLVEAAKKRFLYELYALSESEDVADDKRAEADKLIVAVLGECAVGMSSGSGGAGTSVPSKPERPATAVVNPGKPVDLVEQFRAKR